MTGDSGEKADGGVPVRLKIRLLGSVEVSLGGRRLRAFESVRLQRFLALIALRPDLRHRASLAFELWPDSEERQARTNLRKLLHEVRQVLPDIGQFFEIDKETVALKSSGTVEVDVWMFQDAIRAGDNDGAARVYSGDLLPACYDDWVLGERQQLRRDACAVFVPKLPRQSDSLRVEPRLP